MIVIKKMIDCYEGNGIICDMKENKKKISVLGKRQYSLIVRWTSNFIFYTSEFIHDKELKKKQSNNEKE